jgi:4-hydroxyphenylpyruvate dioxygenase-like putative hemolysin
VVAAGEAQIESTVTGNQSSEPSMSEEELLRNQTQVYLPINNALSSVGHVHGFLDEIGQGVQHLASRVSDLVAFIERVNNYREITGAGLTFLRIPRSYYGRLDVNDLVKAGRCVRACGLWRLECLWRSISLAHNGVFRIELN